jgi:hypothetical protein
MCAYPEHGSFGCSEISYILNDEPKLIFLLIIIHISKCNFKRKRLHWDMIICNLP